MNARKVSVPAEQLKGAVADLSVSPVSAIECSPPIVEVMPNGRIDIVDGYHRVAGLIAGGATEIECVTCDDADLLASAGNAENPVEQAKSAATIYAAAKNL